MRAFKGVKSRMAIEFSGWTGNSKAFLWAYRGSELVPYQQRLYTPLEIRNIRLDILGVPRTFVRPKKLPPIICSRMAKGGTGKTTLSANIAACMAMMGYKVLMIDGDPQSSLSGMYGIDWAKQKVTHVGELMYRANAKLPTRIQEAVIPMYADGMLDLIPSSIDMTGADGWMQQMSMGREQAFSKLLEAEMDFFSQYDVIVIDSAPASSLLTTTFMVASPMILAVVMPEGQSLGALDVLESNVQELNEHFKTTKYNIHIVVNRYSQSMKPHQATLGEMLASHGKFINDTIVRDFVGFLRETSGTNKNDPGPLLEKEPNSVGARDILDLTKSLIKLYGIKLTDGIASTV
ncbi:chromosome partitioning protein [Oxalobacteraceae bacterium GrIS 1.11]